MSYGFCYRYNRPKYFTGTFDAFVKISKVEGITSLWSGLSPTLVLVSNLFNKLRVFNLA
jgi:hypothetical protein